MAATVRRVACAGEDAYRVETAGGSSLTVLPRRGAKIVSLVGPAGREWLTQPSDGGFLPDGTDVAFVDAEMCGWDECVPTIDAGVLPGGVQLSDHGDAWNRPWHAAVEDGGLVTSVDGSDWPYSFSRRVGAEGEDLVLTYEVTNNDDAARPFLWAAHPQMTATQDSEVRIDPEPSHVWDVQEGGVTAWPGSIRASVPEETRYRKLWSMPEHRTAGLELRHPDAAALTFSWTSRLPIHAGIWMEDGAFARERVVALEPATGWFDSAALAHQAGHCLTLAPGEVAAWELRVRATA